MTSNRSVFTALLLAAAGPGQTANTCDHIPDMFCVSQQVFSHFREGRAETTEQMFVYRFKGGSSVEIAHGNPPVTKTEPLLCVEGRTYKALMLYSFSDDWRQGVAAFIDPGMSTVEFLNCAPED